MRDALEAAHGKLKIQSVFLKDWRAGISADYDVQSDSLDSYTKQGFRNILSLNVEELDNDESGSHTYKFIYGVGLRYVKESDEKADEKDINPILLISAEFEATYYSEAKLEDGEIDKFSEQNVGFNVWPFWRELVQTSSTRFGLPVTISIPFYQSEDV